GTPIARSRATEGCPIKSAGRAARRPGGRRGGRLPNQVLRTRGDVRRTRGEGAAKRCPIKLDGRAATCARRAATYAGRAARCAGRAPRAQRKAAESSSSAARRGTSDARRRTQDARRGTPGDAEGAPEGCPIKFVGRAARRPAGVAAKAEGC